MSDRTTAFAASFLVLALHANSRSHVDSLRQPLAGVGACSSGTTASATLGDITFSVRIDAYADWISGMVLMSDSELEPDNCRQQKMSQIRIRSCRAR